MICGFVWVVKCVSPATQVLSFQEWSWPEIQAYLRKHIACSMYEFKEHTKGLVITNCTKLSTVTKDQLLQLKANFMADPKQVRK